MDSPMERTVPTAASGFDDCLLEVIGLLAELENLRPSEPARDTVLARLTVTVEELDSLLDGLDPASAVSTDACDAIAAARTICDEDAADRRRAGSSKLAA